MLGHALRAIAPSLPAVGAVLLARSPGFHRTGTLALAELALYLAVTLVATFLFERELLKEVVGYLRTRSRAQPAAV
jgi:hypothetical protein